MGATGTAPQLDPEELARRQAESDRERQLREARAREIHAASLRHPDRELALEYIASRLKWDAKDLLRRGVGWNGERVVFPIAGDDGVVTSIDRYAAPATRARELVDELNPKLKALGSRSLWPAPATVAGDVLLLVEGAPCSASVLAVGFACVAFPSATGLHPSDAERLRGRELVLVLADADGVGRRAAQSSALLLRALELEAKAIDLFPRRNGGWDVADALREHDNRDEAAGWLTDRLAPFLTTRETG